MYKMVNGLVDVNYKDIFVMNNNERTRGHNFKLSMQRSVSEIRRNFLTSRVVVPWNNLPNYVMQSQNIPQFKRNYDKFMKQCINGN